jgi:hypothetical protein
LRLLVVNEPDLAESIGRLRGEWAERGGGSIAAQSKSWSELAAANPIDADVIVFPARYLGALCVEGRLRPMRDSVLHGKLYNADGVFPLARQKLGAYGGEVMALPISVLMPIVSYPDSWLVTTGNATPNTWSEYQELIARVHAIPSFFPPQESISTWPAIMLLARAAAYACHPHQEAALFDPESMQPRIAEEPFVRALDEWRNELILIAQANETGGSSSAAADNANDRLVWAELPGSEHTFNRSTSEWESLQGDPHRVPLLADGWLVAVTTTSRNAATAFELAAWLVSALPVRRAQFAARTRGAANSLFWASESGIARSLESALNRNDALVVPRVPGVDEYLGTLADAVRKGLDGEEAAATALQNAARKWNEITDRFGRAAQRTAYLKHLGIREPSAD